MPDYPAADRLELVDDLHGRAVPDPYRWLEDPTDPRTVSWLHADSVLLFLGLTVGLLVALRVTHAPPRALRLTALLLVVSLIQGLVGYAQYFSGLPWALVAFHMLGACLVWAVAIFVLLSMRSRGIVRALEGARD